MSDVQEFKVLLSKGTYRSYHNRYYFAGACNVGKSTLAGNLIGEVICVTWKSTDGLKIYFGCNGIDIIKKKMVPLTKGLGDSDILSNVLRGLPSIEQRPQHEAIRQITDSQKKSEGHVGRKNILKHIGRFFQRGLKKTQMASKTEETPSLETVSCTATEAVFNLQKLDIGLSEMSLDLMMKQGNPFVPSKQVHTAIHRSIAEEIRRGRYKVLIAPSDLVDFGGQKAYDMTHQLFIQQKGAFVLMLDGRKHIDDILTEYQVENMTTRLILLHWVSSILTYCSIDDDDIYPLIVFAATHRDALTKEEQQNKTQEITGYLTDMFQDHEHSKRIKFQQLFFINATDREDDGVQSLTEFLVDAAFHQKSWGQNMPMAWVPLELQIAEIRSNDIFIISLTDVDAMNKNNDDLSLEDAHLKHFLRYQHSSGKIMYFDVHGLDQFIIVQPTALVDVLRSFVTDDMFWPDDPSLRSILNTADKKGIIKKNDLFKLWSQEEFDKYVPSDEMKIFIAEVLVHLDILVEPKRFHAAEKGLRDSFIIPCLIKQSCPSTLLPLRNNDGRAIFLSYKLLKSTIPNALVYKLIGAVLNIWPLKTINRTWCLYDKTAILAIDKECDLYLSFSDNRFNVVLKHERSKQCISPDIASIVHDCLTLTLTKVLEFYHKSFGNFSSLSGISSLFEVAIGEECGEEICYISISSAKDKPSWTCEHDILHETKYPLYWIFDKTQIMCTEECKGLDAKCLCLVPEDKHLIRFTGLIGREFYQLMIHLGLTKNEYDFILDNNSVDIYKFICLCKWRKNKQAKMKKPTFADLSQALTQTGYSIHFLCQIFREKSEVYAIEDSRLQDRPEEGVFEELCDRLGPCAFQLGVELGLEVNAIEETMYRYPKDMQRQILDVLCKWKNSSRVEPTIRTLMLALQQADPRGLHFLLEKLEGDKAPENQMGKES